MKKYFTTVLKAILFPSILEKETKEAIKEKIDKVVDEMQNKLYKIEVDNQWNGVAKKDFDRPILAIPVVSDTWIRPETHTVKVNHVEKKVKRLYRSYIDTGIPYSHMEQEAVFELSKMLVEEGYLNMDVEGGHVIYWISCFK